MHECKRTKAELLSMNQNPGEFIPISRLSNRGRSGSDAESIIPAEHSFHAVINLVRRRKFFIAAVLLTGTLLTGVAAFVVSPIYTATAQFTFEPTQAQTAAGMLEPVADMHIATLTSDARLRDVLKALPGLPQYRAVTARALSEITNPTLESHLRDGLVAAGNGIRHAVRPNPNAEDISQSAIGVPSLEQMRNSLLVRQERRANVITVGYKDVDPERASIIANQIVQLHVDRLADQKRQQADAVRRWLDDRLTQSQAELEAADEALRIHVAAHGTPTADTAAGELTAEMSRQLEVVRSELRSREGRRERVRDLRRSGAPPAAIDALLREPLLGIERPGAGAASAASEGKADESSGTTPADPTVLDRDSEQRLQRLAHDVDVFRLQEQSLAERVASLQTASSAIQAQRRERQTLERRAAAAAEVVRDLLRQQQEPKDPGSTGVQILAQATVPQRPSSLSPYLYIPAAMIAFAALGGVAASVRERMDRTFRSEREVSDALQIGCIGILPDSLGRPGVGRVRSRQRCSPYDRAMEAVAAVALDVVRNRGDGRILAVTSSRSGEGKEALALGIATFAARCQRRVLLICAGAPTGDVAAIDIGDRAEADVDITAEGACFEIRRNAGLGFDYLALDEICEAEMASLVGGELAIVFDKLRDCYDYMIIDAPGVFECAGVRILAARVDGILFAVRWGSTRRDVAANAIELLMKPALLSGAARPNVFAVLTHVNLKAHAGYHRGDIGEFLGERH